MKDRSGILKVEKQPHSAKLENVCAVQIIIKLKEQAARILVYIYSSRII